MLKMQVLVLIITYVKEVSYISIAFDIKLNSFKHLCETRLQMKYGYSKNIRLKLQIKSYINYAVHANTHFYEFNMTTI